MAMATIAVQRRREVRCMRSQPSRAARAGTGMPRLRAWIAWEPAPRAP